ncbi:MAG: EamA/RhaT family transporter [Betaproteobacteria bacterium]|nr:EamA/RhaT family transporter [Betaproteobacteria bacterium]
MPLWIPISVAAALFQTWRTAMQQKLRGQMSVSAAGFVRYLYGAPVALVLFLLALVVTGAPIPSINPTFLMWCALGGLGQILATNLLIMSFGYRNFAVGTAYSKTETVQSAVIALIVLNEALSPPAWIGIIVGLIGVMTLSLAGCGLNARELLRATVQPAALCGLGSGMMFAFTVVFIKLASHAISAESLVVKALLALVISNTMQIAMQGAYLLWREPAELKKTFQTWRTSMWVGALSGGGSACWFTGFAIADVALVRAVGQVEIVFTLLFSRFYLKEILKPGDVAGLCLVVLGVVLIILWH